ncbi:MAG: SgcJ/EcaC family oxidoreductase [Acidobacteriota bacterium]
MIGPDAPIARVMDGYTAAVLAKDVEAFVSLYDPGVRVFDLWGRWSYDGIEAWREMAAGWLGSLGDSRVAVEWENVQTTVRNEVAVAHAFVTYRHLSAGGEERHAMRNRLTWVLRPVDGDWKIVHEHTSAPVDLETSRVLLRP